MYNYLDTSGTIVPDTTTVLTEIENEYKTAFNNQSLVVTPDTPQGALITAETAGRTSLIQNNANLANQINPEISGGIFLDAIAALTKLTRTIATATTVTATLTGQSGTLITAGSVAKSGNNSFELVSNATIAASGTVNATFQSLTLGAIPCPANTLTQIQTSVLGWETVTNTQAGTLGKDTESDSVFRRVRKESLANQGVAIPFAIKSNLRLVSGVNSLSFLENYNSTSGTIMGILMKPNSIFTCIDGGSDSDIAYALYDSKTIGANYNGNTSVTINPIDINAPYTATFQRPTLISIYINITVKVTGTSSNTIDTVRTAILNYANGLTGESGFSVGNDVSCFELSASVASQTNYYVSSVETSIDNITFSASTKTIGLDQKAETFSSYITVTVL
jgi:uncharacterized phage protein gp47/JayE